jgi:hypothetical protein
MGREQLYYTVELKNASIAASSRARDVRLNGQPLTSIRALAGSGQLQFVAEPTKPVGVRVFGGLIGKQVEFTMAEAGTLGERRTIYGLVSAAAPAPAPASEEVNITYQKIVWSW